MTNPILERWGSLGVRRGEAAIFGTNGAVLRTWGGIEDEAMRFEDFFAGGGGVVALQMGNHPSFPALVLACLRVGRAVCLFDASLAEADRSRAELRLGVGLRVTAGDGELTFEHSEARTVAADPGVCLFKLTSGTTAGPEPVGFSARQLVADCDQVCETMGIGAEDRNYGVIAFTHSFGFSNLVTPLLCRGVPLVVADDVLPRAIAGGIAGSRATVLPAVPAMFRGLLAAPDLAESLRLCISAGAPLEASLAAGFHARFGRKLHSFYGASECGGICYDRSAEPVEESGFVGTPLDGVELFLGAGGRPVVRSAAVGGSGGEFSPTDLLERCNGGFRIVGRESDWINVAGRKVNPLEIERVLLAFPGVLEVAVCGVEDARRGQEVCALVAADVVPDAEALRRHCAAEMVSWKVPRRFAFAETIPRTPRGKVSRPAIAREFFR